jgi:AraC-like DNA-binding protein
MKNQKSKLSLFSMPEHKCCIVNGSWNGRCTSHKIRQGISVNITKISISSNLLNTYEICTPNSDYLVGCILVSGQLHIKFSDCKEIAIAPQSFSLFPTKDASFQVRAPKQEKLYLLTYSIPGKLLSWLIKDRLSHVADCYRSADAASRCKYFGIPVNRKIHQSVAEIIGSQMSGRLHQLYLEGLILKIIALEFDQLEKLPRDSDLLPAKSDEEMLREAHKYLLSDLIHPPTIKDISAKFGMPAKRLTTKFKELYGETIYDTLMAKRMAESRKKLEQGGVSIKEVSQAVGYKHVSNFISAFIKYYDLPPRAFLKHKK